jgi:hypothetical protein
MAFADLVPVGEVALPWILAIAGGITSIIQWRRNRRERRKILVNAHIETIHNKTDGRIFHLIPLLISNVGREPVILKEIVFSGPGHNGSPGWFREPGAAYGLREQLLPREIKPAESVELPLLSVAIFRNEISEIAIVDSDDVKHKLPSGTLFHIKSQSERYLTEK